MWNFIIILTNYDGLEYENLLSYGKVPPAGSIKEKKYKSIPIGGQIQQAE